MAKQSSTFDRSRTRKQIAARVRDERAQTMTEYAVILTVITAVVVLAVGFLSTNIGSHITDIASLIK